MLVHFSNAGSQTGVRSWEAISQLGWTVLPQPPHSDGLISSDPWKILSAEGSLGSDDGVVSVARTWLRQEGQRMIPVGHTRPGSTLAPRRRPACRVRRKLGRLNWCSISTVYLLLSRFLNKYLARKNVGHYFLGTPCSFVMSVRLRGTAGLGWLSILWGVGVAMFTKISRKNSNSAQIGQQ